MTAAIGVVVAPDLPTESFVDYVQLAEELGFDELWVVEDCFLRGGIAQAGVALAKTSTIRVGIGILPAGARNAAFACLDIATLAGLFPGRLLVGVGLGMPNWLRQVGAWPASPLTLLEEYIQALKSVLSGASTSVDGRYVQLRDVRLGHVPDIVPPVFAGVRGPKSLALSGRIADGTILAEPTTPEYLSFVREQIGVGAPDHQIVAYNTAAIDDSPARARDRARRNLSWIGDPEWAAQIAPLPFAAELAELRAAVASRREFAALLPDEWVDQLAVTGTATQARARLDELAGAGAHHLILMPAGDQPLLALRSLAGVL